VLAFLFVFSSPSSLLVAHAQTAPSGAGLQTQNRPKIQVTLRTRLRQSKSLAERVDANDRAFRGFPMAARVASHAPECTKLTVEGDRGFESGSLQRGVCLTGAFHGCRRKGPAFAGSVSLGETRERDVLATSRLALVAFL
jgi:hypothetical protein